MTQHDKRQEIFKTLEAYCTRHGADFYCVILTPPEGEKVSVRGSGTVSPAIGGEAGAIIKGVIMDEEKEAIKRHDRMRRLHEERKLEVIGQIMIDPEEKEMFIHLPAGDRLFVMDNDFIHALKNVIKYDDDARTMLTVADIHAVEARRMRREAEARLEIEAKENKQTGDRLRRKLEQADEKAKTEKAKKKKAKK